jgi:hypothetical protein
VGAVYDKGGKLRNKVRFLPEVYTAMHALTRYQILDVYMRVADIGALKAFIGRHRKISWG